MTFGLEEMSLQLKIEPPIGAIALSISAADVPGAKFSALTMQGPAMPRIEIPLEVFDLPTMLNWLLRSGDEAEPLRAELRRATLVLRPFLAL
jgi:hypothetical protein